MKKPYPINQNYYSMKVVGWFAYLINLLHFIAFIGFFLFAIGLLISTDFSSLNKFNFFNFDLKSLIGKAFLLIFFAAIYICIMGFITTFVLMAQHISEIRFKLLYLPKNEDQEPSVHAKLVAGLKRFFRGKGKDVSLACEIKSISTDPFRFEMDERFNQLIKTITIQATLIVYESWDTPKHLKNFQPSEATLRITFLNDIDDFLQLNSRLCGLIIVTGIHKQSFGEIFLPMEEYEHFKTIVIKANEAELISEDRAYRLHFLGEIQKSISWNTQVNINSINLSFLKEIYEDLNKLGIDYDNK